MKICIASDSHDRAGALLAAGRAAREMGAEVLLHCGDVIGGHTLRPLRELGMPVHFVHGNNLGDPGALYGLAARSGGLITYHGAEADLTLAGRRIFITHYPHLARGMACTGDYALVCCGHSHTAEVLLQANILGATTVIANPGTVAGVGAPRATWILGDLATLEFQIFTLPDDAIH